MQNQGKRNFWKVHLAALSKEQITLGGRRKGDDCGGGKMILRKVITSDFYVEPFLRKKNTPVNNNPTAW